MVGSPAGMTHRRRISIVEDEEPNRERLVAALAAHAGELEGRRRGGSSDLTSVECPRQGPRRPRALGAGRARGSASVSPVALHLTATWNGLPMKGKVIVVEEGGAPKLEEWTWASAE